MRNHATAVRRIAGLTIFSQQLLQRPVVQAQVRHHLLEFAVLCLQLLEALRLVDVHAAVLCLPPVVRLLGDAVLSTDVLDLLPRVPQLQDPDDLFLRVPFPPHQRPPGCTVFSRRTLCQDGSVFGEQVKGDTILTGAKYLWLQGKERFARDAWLDFGQIRESSLKTARAWAINDAFSHFWSYVYHGPAQKFFERWYSWAIRSQLEPIKKVARMLKERFDNTLTYLTHRITNAIAEGLNAKIQWIKRPARGCGNRESFRTSILFPCGGLDLYPHGI